MLRQGNADAPNKYDTRRNCSSFMCIFKNSWYLTKTFDGMTNFFWNQIYTKMLPSACKENNGEKSIDLHFSTIEASATHLNLIAPVPSDNQGLHRKIRISILGWFRLCSISAKKIMHLLFFNAKFVLFAENVNLEKKLDPFGSTVRYEMMKLCNGSV